MQLTTRIDPRVRLRLVFSTHRRDCWWLVVEISNVQNLCQRYLEGARMSWRLSLDALADAEDVTVRVPHVHLSHMPRHVRGRKGDLQSTGTTLSVDIVDIVHEYRHPHALVSLLISVGAKR